MSIDPAVLIQGVGTLITVGAVYGTAKATLNGTKDRVKNLELRAAEHELRDETRHLEVISRLNVIETKIDERTEKTVS